MASRGTSLLPILFVGLALIAGVLMEGVSGASPSASSTVRRQLSESVEASAAVSTAATCPIPCGFLLPTCCQLPGLFGLPGAYYCANTKIDFFNCGGCGITCPLGTICCSGKCVNLLADTNNCGFCGNKCQTGATCEFGLCDYDI